MKLRKIIELFMHMELQQKEMYCSNISVLVKNKLILLLTEIQKKSITILLVQRLE